MMQAANLDISLETSNDKNLVKTQAAKLDSTQKADIAKQTEVVEVSKPPSFSRTLEAYSDCV